MEIWKDIKDYEGMYQISNLGNVRSLDYYVNSRQGLRLKRGKKMTATDNGNGYKIIGLSRENTNKKYYIHRLVAEAFLDNPMNYKEINHKDYDRSNNRIENLEWISRVENIRYSIKNRPETTKNCNQYGKYIVFDKRYSSYVVKAWNRTKKEKIYLGSFKKLEQALETRDRYLNTNENK